MKKIIHIIFILVPLFCFSQEKEIVKFRGNLSNYNDNNYKTLTVIDQREDLQIGILPFGENREMREVVFPTTISNDLEKRYKSSIREGGQHELVLVLKKLTLSVGNSDEKSTLGSIQFSGQTFIKKGENYQFIYKKDTILYFKEKKISETLVKNISTAFEYLFSENYTKKPTGPSVTLENLADYDFYIRNYYPIFKDNVLKDGIYLNHNSFLNQKPEDGNFVLERNKKGEVKRAVKNESDKISSYNIFAYVENGKAYRYTFSGFMELSRNEKGFYLLTNRAYLFPQSSNNTYGMYGLIGAVAGTFEQKAKQKSSKNDPKEQVYIDWLTGEFDFPDLDLMNVSN